MPIGPKLLKGALIVFETTKPIPTNLIVFQYNPESVSRSFRAQTSEPDPTRNAGDTQRALPPTESLSMSVKLDAADQLDLGNPVAIISGLHPALAALELLLYPPSTDVILGKVLAAVGSRRVAPAKVPMVLLFWGALRIVPVRVESVSVVERAFDQLLNPIQATVDLGLRTLTEKELQLAGPPFDTLALVQLVGKEVLARTNIFNVGVEFAVSL